ncbi:unnamed protein product, partial [Ceratitis capitata]
MQQLMGRTEQNSERGVKAAKRMQRIKRIRDCKATIASNSPSPGCPRVHRIEC